jgi:hypothetical protein
MTKSRDLKLALVTLYHDKSNNPLGYEAIRIAYHTSKIDSMAAHFIYWLDKLALINRETLK